MASIASDGLAQASGSSGLEQSSDGGVTHPVTQSSPLPGSVHTQEEADPGPGLYAVPIQPYLSVSTGLSSYNLIPLSYKIPSRPAAAAAAGSEQGQQAREQQGPQRPVAVRRFPHGFPVDLFLILKLLALVILFNQEGSKQRLVTLLLFAVIIYLHQTGALAPIVRWLRQQAAPPQPRPAVRVENGPPLGNDNVDAPPAENQNEADRLPVENQNQVEGGRQNGGQWWGIAREIQMFVAGFITSLFPGFHND